jgi:adenylate cyclase
VSETRKLAAILVSDVVGYSRLAGADEDRTLARLRALRSDLIDPIISVHHGRIVKRTGDGSIIEFRSVVDAVRCALEVQTGMIERNAGLPPEKRIEFRIGVHLGDVVEESDGDLMGDGVNIASRLEGVAKPGAICLSEDAYRQVKQRLDVKVIDLGPTPLKNIAEPVRVYSIEVGAPGEAKPPSAGAALKPETLAQRTSIWSSRWPSLAPLAVLLLLAVAGGWALLGGRLMKPAEAAHLSIVALPFANLSGDPAQDYFADGITENLTTELSRIRDSFVIARNTAFTYKGKSIDAKEIGKELGVRYVLEGSVQRDGTRVRVNAQLIDAESGAHLWAERFEEDVADLFKLQDQVVARLGNALGYELIKAEAQRDERIAHPDAFDLTMRGRAMQMREAQQRTKENNNAARAMYERALAIDPNDALALAGEAAAYFADKAYGWADEEVDWDAKILGQADRSIAIAPDDPAPYAVKSLYLTNGNHPVEGLRAADAGLAVNPNDALLHAARGLAENYLGHFEQGISEVGQAMRLSPHDPYIGGWHDFAAEAELGLGHFDAAIEEANKAIDAGYRVFLAYTMLTVAYALNGNLEQAKTALAEARRLNPKLTVKLAHKLYPDFPWMSEGLRKAGLSEE